MIADRYVNAEGIAEDLLILAGATVNSKAEGSYAFMAADILNISGEILKDTFAAGNTINITGNLGRDAYLFGSSINIDGSIGRELYAYGDEINLNGTIGGNISVDATSINISSNAVISGDIEINATNIKIEDGAIINGIVTYNSNAESVDLPQNITTNVNQVGAIKVEEKNEFIEGIKSTIKWLLINIVLFAVTMLVCPGLFMRIEKVFNEKGGEVYASAIGWGLLFIIVIPIIAIIALITVIGSALGFASLLAYTVIIVYSTVITGYLLGTTMFINKEMNKYLVGIIGIIAIQILRKLPVIGGLISFATIVIAFGMIKEIMKKAK